jgi:ABC-type proline/glycine betaine transport system permease subunit
VIFTLKAIFEFPFVLKPDVNAIDQATRSFAVRGSWFFEDIIGSGLISFVGGIRWFLEHIPWALMILAVFFLGWKVRGKLKNGILYASLLFLVGVVGLWSLMLMTLSIVIASVLIALVLGFPLGVLISGSEKANRFARPILDTMQTMPVFVYLIPALLFFGMGSASAVIATVVYAIVPVIRLTSLGIRQVDADVVEAARAFGSTRWQTLIKVQIPQALPTIMTGVNQTLMMAMSMVVTCSMIGARGLGNEVLIAVNRTEIGRGLISGSSVVVLAVILDRLTQGWFSNDEKTAPSSNWRNIFKKRGKNPGESDPIGDIAETAGELDG